MGNECSMRNRRNECRRASCCDHARYSALITAFAQNRDRQSWSRSNEDAYRRSEARTLWHHVFSNYRLVLAHFLFRINGLCSRSAIFDRRSGRRGGTSLTRSIRYSASGVRRCRYTYGDRKSNRRGSRQIFRALRLYYRSRMGRCGNRGGDGRRA